MVDLIPDDPGNESSIESGPAIWIAIWIVAGLTLWALIALVVQSLV